MNLHRFSHKSDQPPSESGPTEARGDRSATSAKHAKTAVELDQAAVQLGGRTIWRDVNASVGRGEFVAVLGPNGAGKTTLVQAILGLIPLASGSARVLGGSPGSANARIGYLPQRRSFDAASRIRGSDLVRLGLDGHKWGMPLPLPRFAKARRSNERAQRVWEAISLVDAEGYAQRPLGELSGGEQQRLLIAQALVHRPDLLILDEPLDSLDLPNQSTVAALVQRICKRFGVSVLLVAHDINPISAYLDRVIYFAANSAVEGTPQEVITTETLTSLYGAAVEVLRTPEGRLVVVGTPEAPALHSDRHD
jgi:zinc/manganese transport system ATP-binding protein